MRRPNPAQPPKRHPVGGSCVRGETAIAELRDVAAERATLLHKRTNAGSPLDYLVKPFANYSVRAFRER